MADEIMARDAGVKFEPHPEGQYAAVCVDVVSLGEKVETFAGNPPRIVAKCAVIFRTGEQDAEGESIDVSAEFTVSMNEKAGLRLFLEAWRGKSYTDDQAKQGVPVHRLVAVGALLSVEHKKSAKGRLYAKIKSVSPLPKAMSAPTVGANQYQRANFWSDRRKVYGEEVAKYRREIGASSHDDYNAPSEEADDDLPF